MFVTRNLPCDHWFFARPVNTPPTKRPMPKGELLIEHVRDVLREDGRDDIHIAEQECLWSCKRHCNVWFRDTKRFSYIAGDFEPTRQAAEAIVGWFELHGESELGTVPFRQWPDGMRGHFIARMPPEDR